MHHRARALVASLLATLVSIAASVTVTGIVSDSEPVGAHRAVPPGTAIERAVGRSAAVPTSLTGIASNYGGTAGWIGEATVALPGAFGGSYTGAVNGKVTVCADRCARLPVVDWCECYWASDEQRVIDLSPAAWAIVSDESLATGLIDVRLRLAGSRPR